MKKIGLFLAGLVLIVSFAQMAVTISDSSYDRMADVNRDRTVDVNDLSRLGKAYGSNLILPTEPSKTVVTVLSFDQDPPEVENAKVAVIDAEMPYPFPPEVNNVTYTDSSGIAAFDLSSNKNYTAIAWSSQAHNYANFTTNSQGEASILITLGEPSIPPIRSLPQGWIVVTLLDNETGSLVFGWDISPYDDFAVVICSIGLNLTNHRFSSQKVRNLYTLGGVFLIPPSWSGWSFNEPFSKWGLWLVDSVNGYSLGSCVYSPDENGCANAVIYATLP
jgi:hypothetical protein